MTKKLNDRGWKSKIKTMTEEILILSLLLPSSVPVGSPVPVELRLALSLIITTHPTTPPPTQAFHHDVSVHLICTGSDKIFAKCRCLDHRPNTLVPQRSRSRHSKIQWSTYTKIPRISGYSIPNHVNTISHLSQWKSFEIMPCEVSVESIIQLYKCTLGLVQ